MELEHAAQNAKKRCPVTLANNVPTAKVGNDNLVAAWGDAKVASDVPKTWNPAAVGNILGKSATPVITANVPVDDGASASKLSFARANPKSPKPVGPAKVLASAPPSQPLAEDMPPASMSCIPPPKVPNPFMNIDPPSFLENLSWPKNLVQLAKEITRLPSSKPTNPEFSFFMDQKSAQKNMCVLKKYDYDLKAALAAQQDSPLTYGSEFKPVNILESVFGLHPNWRRMKTF